MKKLVLVILSIVICVASVGLVACDNRANDTTSNAPSQFGEFSYKGKTLKEYAVNTITAEQAKEMLAKSDGVSAFKSVGQKALSVTTFGVRPMSLNTERDKCYPSDEIVNEVLQNYAGCNVTTKYYIEDSDNVQLKTDKLTGIDFKSVLQDNHFTPFNQLVAKNIIVYDGLIDYMEEQNKEFASSDMGLVAPFKTIFSYHTDADGNLIIQIRDYAEIASSVGGGIGCSYRQDTEIVYDESGKMVVWQTSLGISSSTPQGTMREGYILEMSVEWIGKI